MKEFTFKDTGVTVMIRKVSPLLAFELRKRNPAPKPPKNKVELDGKTVYEENLADPDYEKAQAEYEQRIEELTRRLIIRRGVVHTLTESQKAEVDELKAYWLDETGEVLVGSDLDIFISYVAIGTDSDLGDLIDEILKRSQPTEGEVKEVLNSFPGEA